MRAIRIGRRVAAGIGVLPLDGSGTVTKSVPALVFPAVLISAQSHNHETVIGTARPVVFDIVVGNQVIFLKGFSVGIGGAAKGDIGNLQKLAIAIFVMINGIILLTHRRNKRFIEGVNPLQGGGKHRMVIAVAVNNKPVSAAHTVISVPGIELMIRIRNFLLCQLVDVLRGYAVILFVGTDPGIVRIQEVPIFAGSILQIPKILQLAVHLLRFPELRSQEAVLVIREMVVKTVKQGSGIIAPAVKIVLVIRLACIRKSAVHPLSGHDIRHPEIIGQRQLHGIGNRLHPKALRE